MSIQTEINRINGNISDAYDAVSNKGGTIPALQDSAHLASAIGSIPGGASYTVTDNAQGGVTVDIT